MRIHFRGLLPGCRHSFLCGLNLVLLCLMTLPLAAQPPEVPDSFRQLKPGTEITVLAASSRRTDIAVEGQPEVTTESSETMQIQYRIVGLDPSGNMVIRALVQNLDHRPRNANVSQLRFAPVLLGIQPDGIIRALNPAARDALISNLSNGDPESMQVLRTCLTDETIAGWFSVPFWMLRPGIGDAVENVWERGHEVSLGALGSLHMDLSFQAETPENKFAKVVITGKGRFLPLVLPDSKATAFPFLSDATVEIDELSGTGKLFAATPDDTDQSPQRPEFESLEWTIRLHGNANLVPANATKKATESGMPPKVTFRQLQNHVWTLQRFTAGNQSQIQFYDKAVLPEKAANPE